MPLDTAPASPPETARTPTDIDRHVGTRLRLRRAELEMSQEELGNKLGVTFQQVQKYERGANRLGASRLWSAARALEVPVQYFYEGLDAAGASDLVETGESNPLYEFLHSPDGIAVARAFAAIKRAASRTTLLALMRTMD